MHTESFSHGDGYHVEVMPVSLPRKAHAFTLVLTERHGETGNKIMVHFDSYADLYGFMGDVNDAVYNATLLRQEDTLGHDRLPEASETP